MLNSLIGTPDELFMEQKGIRSEKYAYSELSRPQYIKYRPTNSQGQTLVGSSSSFTFSLPQTLGRGLFCPADAGTHMLVFDMQIAHATNPVAPIAPMVKAEVDPWRFFDSLQVKANQTLLNNGDNNRQWSSLAEIVDFSPEYLAQFADAGVNVMSGPDGVFVFDTKSTVAGSAIDRAGFRADKAGWVVKPGVFAISTDTTFANAPTYRVAVPLTLLSSGVLSDRNSIWPLSVATELTLNMHAQREVTYQVNGYGNNGAWIDGASPAMKLQIQISNLYLTLLTVDTYGSMRNRMSLLLKENRYVFKTITDKTYVTTCIPPATGTLTVNLQPLNYSLHSIESFFVDETAITQSSVDKKLLPDEGVIGYRYLIGSQPHPPLEVECGYNDRTSQSGNRVDGYSLYQTFQRQKAAHQEEWYNQVQSCVSRTSYDGRGHVQVQQIGAAPQCGYYPTASIVTAPDNTGVPIVNGSAGSLKFNRMFKMTLPLASITADQDFISGFQGNFTSLELNFNNLRSRYLPDAAINTNTGGILADTTWVASTSLQIYTRARVATMVVAGLSTCMVFEQASPALSL